MSSAIHPASLRMCSNFSGFDVDPGHKFSFSRIRNTEKVSTLTISKVSHDRNFPPGANNKQYFSPVLFIIRKPGYILSRRADGYQDILVVSSQFLVSSLIHSACIPHALKSSCPLSFDSGFYYGF